jgi:hypothetical protein
MTDVIPRRFLPLVLAALGVGLLLMALGNFNVDEGEQGGPVAFVVTVIVMLVATFLIWQFVVEPRAAGSGGTRAAIVLGALSVPLGFLYWTGLPWALAPAAIALGTMARGGGGDAASAPRERATAASSRAGAGADRPGGGAEGQGAAAGGVGPIQSRAQEAMIAVGLGWAGLVIATVFGLIDVT